MRAWLYILWCGNMQCSATCSQRCLKPWICCMHWKGLAADCKDRHTFCSAAWCSCFASSCAQACFETRSEVNSVCIQCWVGILAH
jgi:hypothetical protein